MIPNETENYWKLRRGFVVEIGYARDRCVLAFRLGTSTNNYQSVDMSPDDAERMARCLKKFAKRARQIDAQEKKRDK